MRKPVAHHVVALGAATGAWLCCGLAAALAGQSGSSGGSRLPTSEAALVTPQSPLAQTSSLLSDAEKVVVKFRGFPDMSGDYRINADETMTIPVIGRVKITGYSPEQLEQILSEKMTSVTGRESYATGEIAEYRPVFVTG